MLQQENQTQSANFEWVCQALSATGEPCDTSATCHCGVCRTDFPFEPAHEFTVSKLI